jgi:hypothetical protein
VSDEIGAFLRAERGHQRAGNAASVSGSREDFHLQVDAQLGAQTKAPRQPGRSKLHTVRYSGGELNRLDLQDFAGIRESLRHHTARTAKHRNQDLGLPITGSV